MPRPSGPRSGKHGYVNGMPAISRWSLNLTSALETQYNSLTHTGPHRGGGVKDWNGVFEGFGGAPGVFPGDIVDLRLFTGPSTGVFGDNGMVYQGNAIIDSLAININFQPNASITYAVGFSGDGCLQYAENKYSDATAQCRGGICCSYLEIACVCSTDCDPEAPSNCADLTGGWADVGTGTDEEDYTRVENIQSITLTFNANNIPVVNSSTNCCTEREAGIVDWTLAIVDQEQYPMYQFDTYYAVKLWIDSLHYWKIQYLTFAGISDLRVDRASQEIISKTNTFLGSGAICCGWDTRILGRIVTPENTLVWPV